MSLGSKVLLALGGLAVLLASFLLTLTILDRFESSAPEAAKGPSVWISVNGSDAATATIQPGTPYTVSYNSQDVKSCTLRHMSASGVSETPVSANSPGSGQSASVGTYMLICAGQDGKEISKSIRIVERR